MSGLPMTPPRTPSPATRAHPVGTHCQPPHPNPLPLGGGEGGSSAIRGLPPHPDPLPLGGGEGGSPAIRGLPPRPRRGGEGRGEGGIGGGVEICPSNVLQRLREIYLMTGARNALLYQELGLVLQALQQDNIPVIVLKGAHLAALVYRHIALRPMSDLDLLVHRSDLERAVTKLHDLGFTGPPAGEVPMVSQEGHHLPMMHKAPETGIEVHWAPFWPPRLAGIANDGCWARSCRATIAGAATRVLSPEDLLLHVCLHDACDLACGPFGLGLRPLCDIAEIIRHYRETLSWPEVQARAVEWRTERCVYLALRLARELLGAEVPESIMGGLCPRDFDERWAAVGIKQVLETPVALSRGPGLQQAPLRVWAESCRSQWRRGNNEPLVRAVVRAVFPSREHMARYMAMHHSVSLDGVRRYSCYLTRAWDWGRKIGDWAWQRATRPRRMAASAQQAREHDRLWNWLSSAAATMDKPEPAPTATPKA